MQHLMFFISVILILVPLIYILKKKQFQVYFVYFVATSSFLIVNLLGSVSGNITGRYHQLGFSYIFLCTAVFFHVLFWVLQFFPKPNACINRPWAVRFLPSFNEYQYKLKKYVLGGVVFSFIAMCIFSLKVEPPFFLQYSLLKQGKPAHLLSEVDSFNSSVMKVTLPDGDKFTLLKPPAMNYRGVNVASHFLSERMYIVAVRSFHWFALAAFDLPLLLLSLVLTINLTLKDGSLTKEYKNWRKVLVWITIFTTVSSLWILSKDYLMYLIFTVYLIYVAYKNEIAFKNLSLVILISTVLLALLYRLYGANLNFNYPIVLGATLYHRLMEVYPWSAAVVYDLFPNKIPFLHGASVINMFHIFHRKTFFIATLTYWEIYGSHPGCAPVPAIFESYANWGWLGAIGTQLTIMLTILGISLLSWTEDIWLFSLACFLTIKLVKFWQAPLWYAMFEPTLMFFVIVMFVYYKLYIKSSKPKFILDKTMQ